MHDAWDPELYERFKHQRAQPARDLMALVARQPGMRVLDLGCGTGEITAELHGALGAASTLGIDRSTAMLAQASARQAQGLRFTDADIRTFAPDGALDLVYSNAALQWVDDHPALLARFKGWLAPGGQLAIQVPCADGHPTHTVAQELGERYGTGSLYHGGSRVLNAEGYAALLYRLGFEQQQVFTRVYGHVLPDIDALVTFFSSTLLNPYKAALGEPRFAEFLRDYRAGLASHLGEPKPLFFPMARTLLWARMPQTIRP
ncbi:MAG: methyltransferase domain-containing protein [Planctomycetes bacterium]|nr:methyltransferase domain-containing protein [Planctomycetota bacterium]MCW8137238.1 methyltransferase domain-containing protein [Planctomycetota bacterium]